MEKSRFYIIKLLSQFTTTEAKRATHWLNQYAWIGVPLVDPPRLNGWFSTTRITPKL
ncbi:hypothetical protein ACFLU1_06500 [Chloroflexota bacterium]